MLNPIDLMVWALAGVIAFAALIFIFAAIAIIMAIIRNIRKNAAGKPDAKTETPAGDTYVFNGEAIAQNATDIAAEIAKRRDRRTDSQ